VSSRGASLGLLVLLCGCAFFPERELVTVSDGRYVMGTVLEITLVGRDEGEARAALVEMFALAERLDALLTVYDPESELSRLNRAAGQGRRAVDPELARILALSKAYARLTRGSFDVTVGPLVELWTEAARRRTPPSAAALVRARERVGAEYVRITLLEERGIENAFLSFGQSSTWALGRPTDATGWRLLARGPDEGLLGVLTLKNQALSVSGSLGQWVEIGGRRYGHVLDPRTGEALQRRRQALVVAPDASLAEALSKALLVLGKREGLALVDAQESCEALLVDAEGGTWFTAGWNAAVRFDPRD